MWWSILPEKRQGAGASERNKRTSWPTDNFKCTYCSIC